MGSLASLKSFPRRPIAFAHPSYNGLDLFMEFPTVILLFWLWRNILSRSVLMTRGKFRHTIWLVRVSLVSSPPSQRCYLNYTMRIRTQILISELAWTKSECVISALVKIL